MTSLQHNRYRQEILVTYLEDEPDPQMLAKLIHEKVNPTLRARSRDIAEAIFTAGMDDYLQNKLSPSQYKMLASSREFSSNTYKTSAQGVCISTQKDNSVSVKDESLPSLSGC